MIKTESTTYRLYSFIYGGAKCAGHGGVSKKVFQFIHNIFQIDDSKNIYSLGHLLRPNAPHILNTVIYFFDKDRWITSPYFIFWNILRNN